MDRGPAMTEFFNQPRSSRVLMGFMLLISFAEAHLVGYLLLHVAAGQRYDAPALIIHCQEEISKFKIFKDANHFSPL